MSIDVYTGTPGSGKSAHAAREIRNALTGYKYPRPVLANFELGKDAPIPADVRDNYIYMPNEDMSSGKITDFCNEYWDSKSFFKEDYILLVIDECQLLFNSRRWSDKSRMSYLEFLSQSRKYGVRVLLIAQSAKMIDNQFRMLIETEHNHRRISSMGLVGGAVSLLTLGRLRMVVSYLYQTNERLGMSLFMPGTRDFKMYNTYAMFNKQLG